MGTGFIPPQFLTPSELAEMLKLSKATVYRMVDKQELPFCKIGGSLRFRMSDVVEYIENCRIKPANEIYEHIQKK